MKMEEDRKRLEVVERKQEADRCKLQRESCNREEEEAEEHQRTVRLVALVEDEVGSSVVAVVEVNLLRKQLADSP